MSRHHPPELVHVSPTHLRWGRRKLVNFGGSDYFRLAWDSSVRESVARAARDLGHNFGASRCTTGNHPLYRELEDELAAFAKTESALVTSTGYSAPMIAAQGLASEHTHVFLDSKGHSCLHDAARLTGLPTIVFPHGGADALREALRKAGHGVRPLVLCDGLSAHLGNVFPVDEYLAVLPAKATFLVDDAHGFFVLGQHGRGTVEHLGLRDPRILVTTTMSKALGAFGGVVFCTARQREQVVTRSRPFAGGSPLSLVLVAAARTALGIVKRRGTALRQKLLTNTSIFHQPVNVTGIEAIHHAGPMFACSPADPRVQRRLKAELLAAGIYPTLIRYDGGPADAFFRFAISTAHTTDQLRSLRDVLMRAVDPAHSKR